MEITVFLLSTEHSVLLALGFPHHFGLTAPKTGETGCQDSDQNDPDHPGRWASKQKHRLSVRLYDII